VSRFSRFLLPLAFALAFTLPPLLVGGVGIGRAMLASLAKAPSLSTALPAQPAHDPSKPTAVVLAGNHNTESSDLLGPYETLATSGRFNVYVAAPERRPSPLFPGKLNLVPHYSFAEYDQAFGGRPDLVVVPYIPDAEPAVLEWIRAKAAAGSTILSICAGAQVVADAGVLGGQSATTHHDTLPVVEKSHPEVQWVHNRRYVDSGQFISSAGITSGVDASLYTLERFFGRDVADQTAQAMGYPHTRFLDDPTWLVPSNNIVQTLPNAYRMHPTQIGMVLYDGVREVEVSSILDTYPRSYAAEVQPLGLESGIIQTRHGLDLLAPADLSTASKVDRVLLPGAPDTSTAARVDVWAAGRGLRAERIHGSGAYAYDATLRDMAHDESNSVVREAATGLEYPTRDLQLTGPEWRLDLVARPLALGLLGLSALLLLRNRRRLAVGA
jgi:putative intracellular protease/amidase